LELSRRVDTLIRLIEKEAQEMKEIQQIGRATEKKKATKTKIQIDTSNKSEENPNGPHSSIRKRRKLQ